MILLFVLSPANCSGARAALLTRPGAKSAVARALASREGAPLKTVFTFLSSLYFRGKLAYAERFAVAPHTELGAWLIAPGRGLCHPDERVTLRELEQMAAIEVAAENETFARPLRRAAHELAGALPEDGRVVLLGSIASAKYVEPLGAALGERLLFPSDFVGRGDMSRGALLLRAARSGVELPYAQVVSHARRGPRAPRIAQLRTR